MDDKEKLLVSSVLMMAAASLSVSEAAPNSESTLLTASNSEMVLIPASDFIMGSDKIDQRSMGKEFGNVKPWYLDEHPEKKVFLDSYYIDKFEVTNAQYRDFVKQLDYAPPEFWLTSGYLISLHPEKLNGLSEEKLSHLIIDVFRLDVDTRKMNKEQLLQAFHLHFKDLDQIPVYEVSWFDAKAYCEWKGKHLPTEMQWEKAARGSTGSEFPWGNDWKSHMSNTGDEEWVHGAAPVGSYATDKSPTGVFDMAGNVSEWVEDWYKAYPDSKLNSPLFGEQFKVVRGAGWGGDGHYALEIFQRGAYRFNLSPDQTNSDLGFRCAMEATPLKMHASDQ